MQITDGVTHTQLPVFDADGKYLYFASSANAGTSEFGWGVLNGVFANPLVVRRVHAFLLSKDTPSPLLPERSAESGRESGRSERRWSKIDFDNPSARFINLPLPQRDYAQLGFGQSGKIDSRRQRMVESAGRFSERSQSQAVYFFDMAKGGRLEKIVDEIDAVDITRDGEQHFYRKGSRLFSDRRGNSPPKPDEGKQNFSKMEVRVNPAEEWRQMFHESMRIMRDWFYDPNYHGQNLALLEREYAAYLPTDHAPRRFELADAADARTRFGQPSRHRRR